MMVLDGEFITVNLRYERKGKRKNIYIYMPTELCTEKLRFSIKSFFYFFRQLKNWPNKNCPQKWFIFPKYNRISCAQEKKTIMTSFTHKVHYRQSMAVT